MEIKYPDTIFTEVEIMEMWNKAFEEDPENYHEFRMRADREHMRDVSKFPGVYYAAIEDGKIIGYSGWRDEGSYFVMSGSRTAKHRKKKLVTTKLRAKKMEKINKSGKPSIVILSNQEFPEAWAESWKKLGWVSLSGKTTKDKLRDWLGDDGLYLKYREWEDITYVYFPSGFNKAWAILTNYQNHILEWEGY
tara:strand:+ start:827 stop:1402 length:576 start_codon:yes stop_codon:yes gene_type:complete